MAVQVRPVRRRAVRSRAGAALVVVGAVLAGCGGEVVEAPDPVPRDASRGPIVAPPAGGTARTDPLRARSPARPVLTITVDQDSAGAVSYRAPRTVRGGLVEIRLRNAGGGAQKAQVWRIDGNHTVKEALKARHPLPDWLRYAGGVGLTRPGRTGRTLQALPAGRYYVGGTMEEPGSVASFSVTEPGRAPSPARAPARIEAIDFSFRASGLRAGPNSVDFDNTGREPHHAFMTRMRDDAELADVRRFFTRRVTTGPPPVDTEVTRETAVLEGGERQVTQMHLAAGRYAVICFVRNRHGGPLHLELGMINEVRVR